MRTPSMAGSPTFTPPSRFDSAPITSVSIASGTNVRRMAVHFCPAFVVISFATSLMKRSNSSVPGAASGPSIEKLSESASWLNRTLFARIAGLTLSICPVAAEPVNATAHCSSRWSSRSPALPQISWMLPSGNNPHATISANTLSVR